MFNAKATHQKTKLHNRDLVLKTIFDRQPISRAEIARVTQLTRATVSEIINTFLDEGLVEEVGLGSSIGGKSPILLSLVADSRYLIGLNLAQNKFVGAVVNLLGEVKETVEIPVSDSDGKQALEYVYQILDQLLACDLKPIVGIGIGTPGLVNTREGIVLAAVNLDWQDLPLVELLEERYHLPICVVNDSQANAIGEFVYGGEHEPGGNLVVVNVRHGIGSGILINGQLFQGDGGAAGEIGHIIAQPGGRACRCGKHGCLEAVASAHAIVHHARELASEFPTSALAHDPAGIHLNNLVDAYLAKDPLARKVGDEAALYLGISLASLVNTLNIHEIVLTGEMTRLGQDWLDQIHSSMLEAGFSRMVQNTRIKYGNLDLRGYILGSSALMLLDGYSLLFTKTEE